jgi:large subunit ribosomal protein L15
MLALKQAGLVPELARTVRVIKAGEISKKLTIKGVIVTAGAKAAIEAAGGSVE